MRMKKIKMQEEAPAVATGDTEYFKLFLTCIGIYDNYNNNTYLYRIRLFSTCDKLLSTRVLIENE